MIQAVLPLEYANKGLVLPRPFPSESQLGPDKVGALRTVRVELSGCGRCMLLCLAICGPLSMFQAFLWVGAPF